MHSTVDTHPYKRSKEARGYVHTFINGLKHSGYYIRRVCGPTFPEAVPPATPIMNGDLAKVSGSRTEFLRGLGGGLKNRTSVWWSSCRIVDSVR